MLDAGYGGGVGWGANPNILASRCMAMLGFSPQLTGLHAHLNIYPDQLRPIDHIGQLPMPKLMIVGDHDRHTTITESYALFNAAKAPKELWVVHGAEHVDLCHYAGDAYKAKVLQFLDAYLRGR